MTVREIVINFLKAQGYDGLYSDGTCSCAISDLMPCEGENIAEDCKAGFKQDCLQCYNLIENVCSNGYAFCIGVKREEGDKT